MFNKHKLVCKLKCTIAYMQVCSNTQPAQSCCHSSRGLAGANHPVNKWQLLHPAGATRLWQPDALDTGTPILANHHQHNAMVKFVVA
jgi:hypothetical protein